MTMDDLQQILSRISILGPTWTLNNSQSWNYVFSGFNALINGTTIQGFKIFLSQEKLHFSESRGYAEEAASIHVVDAQGGVVFSERFGEKSNPSEYELLHQWMIAEFRPMYVSELTAQNLKNEAAKREFFKLTNSPKR